MGAIRDNSLFFDERSLKVTFRQRDDRRPNPTAGSGRDFAFQVADTFENSWSFPCLLVAYNELK